MPRFANAALFISPKFEKMRQYYDQQKLFRSSYVMFVLIYDATEFFLNAGSFKYGGKFLL